MAWTRVWNVVVKDGSSVCGRILVAADGSQQAEDAGKEWAKDTIGNWTCKAKATRKMSDGRQVEVWIA